MEQHLLPFFMDRFRINVISAELDLVSAGPVHLNDIFQVLDTWVGAEGPTPDSVQYHCHWYDVSNLNLVTWPEVFRLSIRKCLFTPFSKYIFCLNASNLQFFLLVPKSMLEFEKKNYSHNQQFLLKGPWQLTYIKLSVTPHNTEKIRPKQDPQHILRVCYRIWGMRNGRLSFVGCIWDHHLSNQNSFGGS